MNKLRIRKHEVGLWFRHGDFKQVLIPGAYFVPGRWFGRDRVEVVNTLRTRFEHRLLDILIDDPKLNELVEIVDLNDDQRAVVWLDGRLGYVIGPGRHAFWRRPYAIAVETFDITDPRFEHKKLDVILSHPDAGALLATVRVASHEQAVVFRNGKHLETVDPGRHTYWQVAGRITFCVVDRREQILDVTGQEIMTADKVTLRINLTVTFRVEDVLRAVSTVESYTQAVYREAQLALRAAIGTRRLDELLSSKEAVGAELRDAIAGRTAEFGVGLASVGLRDVILPGEMKTILNQVIEAQKRAEANLIRRREETAAARSQANTARLLADNPVLARMKDLEALQDILAGTRTTFVLGGGDLGDQIRGLVRQSIEPED